MINLYGFKMEINRFRRPSVRQVFSYLSTLLEVIVSLPLRNKDQSNNREDERKGRGR